MESGGSRRPQPLTVERTDSSNLRDFLRIKEDDNGLNSLAGLTLGAVLTAGKSPTHVQANRTLLDIIREDSTSGGKDSKKSWKSFKDKLRLRRAGAAWTSTVPIPASDVPIQHNTNRMITRRQSIRFPATNVPQSSQPELSPTASNGGVNRVQLNSNPSNRTMMLRRNSSRIPERQGSRLMTRENIAAELADHHQLPSAEEAEELSDEEEEMGETEGVVVAEEGGGEAPVRMSLMALLEETDRQMGLDGSAYMMDHGEEEAEEEEVEEEEEEEASGGGGGGGEYINCCVCMVRHKGAAFIPCGHTFCRLCSRELWVQRGNCPLCNGFILEILDIF